MQEFNGGTVSLLEYTKHCEQSSGSIDYDDTLWHSLQDSTYTFSCPVHYITFSKLSRKIRIILEWGLLVCF